MSSTRSPPFTSVPGYSPLETWAAELNDFFPTHLSPTAASSLVVRADELKCLRCGQVHYRIPRQPRSLHWAHHPQPSWSSRYIYTLPETLLQGRVVQPYVDAAHQCLRGRPPPTHAGLVNHQCENPTCSPWARSAHSASLHLANLNPAPQSRLRSSNTLRRSGSKLTYNYDSHLLRGTCTFDAEVAADYMASDSLTLSDWGC
jgi:hypothetical protein